MKISPEHAKAIVIVKELKRNKLQFENKIHNRIDLYTVTTLGEEVIGRSVWDRDPTSNV